MTKILVRSPSPPSCTCTRRSLTPSTRRQSSAAAGPRWGGGHVPAGPRSLGGEGGVGGATRRAGPDRAPRVAPAPPPEGGGGRAPLATSGGGRLPRHRHRHRHPLGVARAAATTAAVPTTAPAPAPTGATGARRQRAPRLWTAGTSDGGRRGPSLAGLLEVKPKGNERGVTRGLVDVGGALWPGGAPVLGVSRWWCWSTATARVSS